MLDASNQSEEVHISKSAFEGMNSLQFLTVDYDKLCIPEGLNCLPNKLRLIHWNYCPLRFWPSKFSFKFLVELIMPNSKFEKLWEGIQVRLIHWKFFSHVFSCKALLVIFVKLIFLLLFPWYSLSNASS